MASCWPVALMQVFGPSTNREIIQRSVEIIRFIAREGELTEKHIDDMWNVIGSRNTDLIVTLCKV
jgi:hypothetical protein